MKLANQGKRWTDSDNNMLRNLIDRECKPEFMAEALGRSIGSIYSQTYKLRLADRKEQKAAEDYEWIRQTGGEEEQLEIDIAPPADSYVVNDPVDKLGEIERMPLDNICDKIDALTEYVGGVNSKLVTMTIGMVALLVLFIVAFAY